MSAYNLTPELWIGISGMPFNVFAELLFLDKCHLAHISVLHNFMPTKLLFTTLQFRLLNQFATPTRASHANLLSFKSWMSPRMSQNPFHAATQNGASIMNLWRNAFTTPTSLIKIQIFRLINLFMTPATGFSISSDDVCEPNGERRTRSSVCFSSSKEKSLAFNGAQSQKQHISWCSQQQRGDIVYLNCNLTTTHQGKWTCKHKSHLHRSERT